MEAIGKKLDLNDPTTWADSESYRLFKIGWDAAITEGVWPTAIPVSAKQHKPNTAYLVFDSSEDQWIEAIYCCYFPDGEPQWSVADGKGLYYVTHHMPSVPPKPEKP